MVNECLLQLKTALTEEFQPRVLVADDNRIIREVIRSQLASIGALVTSAANGFDALEMIRQQPFEVALLDIEMPRISGLEVVRLVRSAPGDYSRVQTFVAMSAATNSQQKQLCFEAGMDDFLGKPFWQKELSERMDRWCSFKDISGERGYS